MGFSYDISYIPEITDTFLAQAYVFMHVYVKNNTWLDGLKSLLQPEQFYESMNNR